MTILERTLDRLVNFDDRSRGYDVRELNGANIVRSYSWRVPVNLDQGADGACVGFSWAQEAAARPVEVIGVDNAMGEEIYHLAQTLDDFPGENYSGSSVLGGAKAMKQLGFLDEYRWAFSLEDALVAISHHGPAVIGINWYEGMFTPDASNTLHVTGKIAGGHAIVVNAVDLVRERVRLHNSWGIGWGISGGAFLSFDDFDRLRKEDGEVCIPVRRGFGLTK